MKNPTSFFSSLTNDPGSKPTKGKNTVIPMSVSRVSFALDICQPTERYVEALLCFIEKEVNNNIVSS